MNAFLLTYLGLCAFNLACSLIVLGSGKTTEIKPIHRLIQAPITMAFMIWAGSLLWG